MAEPGSQYHHYIPQFILKQFAFTTVKTKKSPQEGLLHVFDVLSKTFSLGEVRRTCGKQDLYYKADEQDPMRIEHLLSKLECKTSSVFRKICTAITNGAAHVDVLEKDIHILFKFMNISLRRSEQYRDEVTNPYRENDFLFQQLFDDSRRSGRSADPSDVWLEHLLYLLETSHEDLLVDAEKINDNSHNRVAQTYKAFVEGYALQVWKAADGYEFFLNESLVDFEGDRESRLGMETKETGPQLIWITSDDMNHLILPISPDVAVVFCNEAQCWESPFAESMHRLQIPFPQNSLLKTAPHKDVVNIDVPSKPRGKKTWPPTIAWRVNIGMLSPRHHQIITSYILGHARSLIIVRSRARYERAKRDLEVFSRERAEAWTRQGFRSDYQTGHPQANGKTHGGPVLERMVDEHMSALDDIIRIISTTNEPLPRNKDSLVKSWLAIRAIHFAKGSSSHSSKPDDLSIMDPAIRAALEAAYPPKHPNHRDLITIGFSEFFHNALGEEMFANLSFEISKKISEVVNADTFEVHFEASKETLEFPDTFLGQQVNEHDKEKSKRIQDELINKPSFKSVVRASQLLETLIWMFKERQDILATFVQKIAVPMKDTRPNVIRLRGKRE
ncbi:uncharacterized protein N7482_007555 [Penicillium canariense]|uniref:DUF4238 domain-containing protein n=1 Tax=Penicillium canariense TaxID=189055 RepID=A0A9W9HZN1_9EURO|nr:uncharacterized protein N7482_007555 [Penicillium canariense]KAJ5160551.1 hypothetical protein N7482_007555 [Penicillium canariense]